MTIITIGKSLQLAALLFACAPVAACARGAAQAATPAGGAAAAGTTLQQFEARQERKMLAADTDGDGRISKAEYLASAKAGKRDPAARFAKLDRNGDGFVDKAEIDAVLARKFTKLDTNGDGMLSAAERAAAHAGKVKGATAPTSGA